MPESNDTPHSGEPQWRLGLVQREVVLVVVLAAAAVVLFGVTSTMAEWTAATRTETALTWFDRGQALVAEGRLEAGTRALRRAVSREPLNATYALALVRALTDPSQGEDARAEARRRLVQLREREPDRSEINLWLARLSAGAGQVDDAIRFYNHAMYGRASDAPEVDRRRIRVELATHLLDAGDRERALGELFAVAPDVPDTATDRLELSRLFLRAGDARSALVQLTAALRREPQHAEALALAGEAALALGSFATAERHLAAAVRQGAGGPRIQATLDTVRLVRSLHPLSSGLISSERVRRLRAGLDWAGGRLRACTAGADAATDPRVAEIVEFRRQPLAALRETDTLIAGVDLIARSIEDIRRRCADRDPVEDAWVAIAGAVSGAAGR
jgi:cytochrome c-type biogenesis protein CcmH/NrfG